MYYCWCHFSYSTRVVKLGNNVQQDSCCSSSMQKKIHILNFDSENTFFLFHTHDFQRSKRGLKCHSMACFFQWSGHCAYIWLRNSSLDISSLTPQYKVRILKLHGKEIRDRSSSSFSRHTTKSSTKEENIPSSGSREGGSQYSISKGQPNGRFQQCKNDITSLMPQWF